MKKLIKTDKNGTKYYSHGCAWQRCGGLGGSDAWIHTGWTCYQCGGTGIGPEIISKEYTPEYAAKLQAKREARAEKKRLELVAKSAEANLEFFEKQGYNEEGKTYVVLGDTYSIREQLKEEGAKFDSLIGWHFANKPENHPTVEISVDDVYEKDYAETYRWNSWKTEETFSQKIEQATKEMKPEESESNFFGNIGDKCEVTLTYVKSNGFESTYGYRTTIKYFHIFKDENGNVFIWKTTNSLYKVEPNTVITLKGTIKEHNVYKGIKQTELTRCKVV